MHCILSILKKQKADIVYRYTEWNTECYAFINDEYLILLILLNKYLCYKLKALLLVLLVCQRSAWGACGWWEDI